MSTLKPRGLSHPECDITTIALYDGQTVRVYVRGKNLQDFADDIAHCRLLVTWNGRSFDAPILRSALGIPLDKGGGMAHLDLLPVFRTLNLRGGLKAVERTLGLDRDELAGVDGWGAVRLWNAYKRSGDRRILETLLAYNVADVLSLERLAEYAVKRHTVADSSSVKAEQTRHERNPFKPDGEVLRKVLGIFSS